jgi:hypothetical protein
MDSDHQYRFQTALYQADASVNRHWVAPSSSSSGMKQEPLKPNGGEDAQSRDILAQLHQQQLLIVNSRSRNGLILYKRYYAEFAGPGASVGGMFDLDCQRVLPVGKISLVHPESPDERQRAYLIRRQWIRLTKQITDNPVPLQRAQMILNQFEGFFDAQTIAEIPDEAFALLVGVFPSTIRKVRHTRDRLDI